MSRKGANSNHRSNGGSEGLPKNHNNVSMEIFHGEIFMIFGNIISFHGFFNPRAIQIYKYFFLLDRINESNDKSGNSCIRISIALIPASAGTHVFKTAVADTVSNFLETKPALFICFYIPLSKCSHKSSSCHSHAHSGEQKISMCRYISDTRSLWILSETEESIKGSTDPLKSL